MSISKSLIDLPSNILVEIVARLTLKTLFVARSVCKTFVSLTTPNPHLINLHSSSAAQILVFQFGECDFLIPSCLLRLADQDHDYENSQLKPFFQLPKMGRAPAFSWQPLSFILMNSCNGLVYLYQNGLVDNERSLVCNPVTNEYILIPEVDPEIRLASMTESMWLGFSPASDQYKLLRIFPYACQVLAQVYLIGSDSWKNIDATPMRRFHFYSDLCHALVNGVIIYWHHRFLSDLFSFDFETEKFSEVALPPGVQRAQRTSIGVLGGCLCLTCNDSDTHRLDLWVMTKCGSWRKEFVLDTGGSVYGDFRPLQFLQNGQILMQWMKRYVVCYDPRRKTLMYYELHKELNCRAVALTPSFVPLKDTLKVDKVLSKLRPRGGEKD